MLGIPAPPVAFEMTAKLRSRVEYLEELETTDSCGSSNSGEWSPPTTPQLYSTVPTNAPLVTRPPVFAYGPTGSPTRPRVDGAAQMPTEVLAYGAHGIPQRAKKEPSIAPVFAYGPTGVPKQRVATVDARPSQPKSASANGLPGSKRNAILSTGPTTTPAHRCKAATVMKDPVLSYPPSGAATPGAATPGGASVAAKPILCTGPCGRTGGLLGVQPVHNKMAMAIPSPAKVLIDDEEFMNSVPSLMDPTLPLKKVYSVEEELTVAGAAAMLVVDKALPLKRQISNFLLTEPFQDCRSARSAPVFAQ